MLRSTNIIKKISRLITDKDYRFIVLANKGIYNSMSDVEFLKRKFMANMGNVLDLDNPITFNEKLQWLKLYNRKEEYTMMVDKYAVKKYVSDLIGEKYIIPTLGCWDSFEEIDFSKLPNQFVLKCTHDSGGLVVCQDKNQFNIDKARKKIGRCLRRNYYEENREWPYKNVPRKIICEKYMVDNSTEELRDYKFFCFGGECKCMKVDFDRFIEHHANYYDPKGNLLDLGETICPPDKTRNIILPQNVDKMISFAEQLSKEIPFLRVDFYDVNGQIYFGELTFFPASGFGSFTDEKWDYELGKWIDIPNYIGGLHTSNS